MNPGQPIARVLLGLALALVALVLGAGASMAQELSGSGFVDEVRFLPAARQLVVTGWAAPERPNVFTTNLVVKLDGQEVYRGRIERAERPDVVQSTGRADWLWSGFSTRLAVPNGIAAGPRTVSVLMHLSNGKEFELTSAPAARSVDVPPVPSPRLRARIALGLALLLPLLALWVGRRRPESGMSIPAVSGQSGQRHFVASVLMSFALLVAGGWTGSSLGMLLDAAGVAEHDEVAWSGDLRMIRSDEWQVITPLALSQVNHQPPFPLVNTNLGTDGQNMLVVGMVGVPVAHVSTLAKPATWGFFFLDLRRALAWYWWLPFFACFLSLWAFLVRFFAIDWRWAAGLSLTMTVAPYSVVFSGWPAYTAFFPLLGLLAVEAALRTRLWLRGLVAGVVAGLSVAGFALVLYPAWQISLAWLFVPFLIAWVATRRSELQFGRVQAVAAVAAVAVATWLLAAWWTDASEAIAAIRGSVYPGQRSIEAGGDIDRWFLIKGWLSPLTMYRDSSLMWGASDAGSVALFTVPLLAAVFWRLKVRQTWDPVAIVLCAWTGMALWFMFVGFWPEVAKWTLWGSTTSYRFDLALGLAQLMLFAWLVSPQVAKTPTSSPMGQRLAGLIALFVTVHVAWLFQRVPPAISETVPPSVAGVLLLAFAIGSYALLRARHAVAFAIYAVVMLAAALPFNPLGVAPSNFSASLALAEASRGIRQDPGQGRGIAVVGQRNWAMSVPAAGLPVINSVFYYPQRSLWHALDPQGKLQSVYNRYQRVLLVLQPLAPGATYRIDSPRLDEVRLTVDPVRFDFSLAGARAVLAPAGDARSLAGNASLQAVKVTPEWTLFGVVR